MQLQNDSFGCCGDVKEEGGEEKVRRGRRAAAVLLGPLNGHSPAACLSVKQLLFD